MPNSVKPRLLVITRAFPYPPGEQFVEPEAQLWASLDADVVVMPVRAEGEPRPLPATLTVDHTLARVTKRQRTVAKVRALVSPLTWRDVAALARAGRLSPSRALHVVKVVGVTLAYRDALRVWLRRTGPVDVVYTYWWDTWTNAAQLLKGHGVSHVVTRAHGYDLYDERVPVRYHPLKRQLSERLDLFLAVAQGGLAVAGDHGLRPDQLKLARLGTVIPDTPSATSPTGELHLLTTAAMKQVKRIDRLVDALAVLEQRHPGLQVHWTHFGDGPLRDELVQRAERLQHVTRHWPGNVPHEQVRAHLASHPVDLFVNTSESEGLPVSIMEAMAFGVPALAPKVGGIPEIVPAEGPGGELFDDPSPEALAELVWAWHERAKDADERAAARRIAAADFDQARNQAVVRDALEGLLARRS